MTNGLGTNADDHSQTTKLIYEHIKEAPQLQMEVADKLDDKMLRIFTSATVLIGFLGLSSADAPGWRAVVFLLPLVPYALTVLWTFRHTDPEKFRWGLQADKLPTKWREEEEQVRRALINETGVAYRDNKAVLEDKAWYVRASLVSTGAEVLLVVLVFIVYRLP